MKTLYSIWMVLGVIGFPASVGWLLHRFQKYAKAANEVEKAEQRKRLLRSATAALVFLLILASFFLYSVLTQGANA